jgi:hypothetical protein
MEKFVKSVLYLVTFAFIIVFSGFVTAELWSRLPWPEGSERPGDLIVAPWPTADGGWKD